MSPPNRTTAKSLFTANATTTRHLRSPRGPNNCQRPSQDFVGIRRGAGQGSRRAEELIYLGPWPTNIPLLVVSLGFPAGFPIIRSYKMGSHPTGPGLRIRGPSYIYIYFPTPNRVPKNLPRPPTFRKGWGPYGPWPAVVLKLAIGQFYF